jgi:hypothetical protein
MPSISTAREREALRRRRSLVAGLLGVLLVAGPALFGGSPGGIAHGAQRSSAAAEARLLWAAGAELDAPEMESPEWRARRVELLEAPFLGLAGRGRLAIELFDGERLEVEVVRRFTPRPGSAVWYGGIDPRRPGDHVLLALSGDALAASVHHQDRVLRVRGGPGELLLAELDPEAFDPCGTDGRHAVVSAPGAPVPGERASGGQWAPESAGLPGMAVSTGTQLVDVMTVWTPAARQAAGGTNSMLALIDLAIAEMNLALGNCDAGLSVRLVHTAETNYVESGSMGTDLSRLRNKFDGHMDEVHALRDAYGADTVKLITNSGGACGMAYLMTNVSPGFQSSAFGITRRSCAVGNYTFGHELGHNFGCAHDPDNAGSASHNHAYGYRTPNNQHRTVMAYAPGTRRPLFSSPLHTWGGWVMGIAGQQDNALALSKNAAVIANWRPTAVEFEDCDGNGLPDQVDLALGAADVDQNGILDVCQDISADLLHVSLLSGGTQQLFLNAGPENAGRIYVVLGSVSGETPVTPLLGIDLPLAFDAYFELTLLNAGGGLLQNSIGVLDSEGRATVSFQLPPVPGFIWIPFRHAFLALDEGLSPTFVSGPYLTVAFAF